MTPLPLSHHNQHASSISNSKEKVTSDSNEETELGLENDEEMIELAKIQLSKFQQALEVKVLFFLDFFQ